MGTSLVLSILKIQITELVFFFSILSYDTSQSSYWNLVAVFSQSYINVKSKTVVFSVFTSHVIKTKNRNHSMNKVKNLGYDR